MSESNPFTIAQGQLDDAAVRLGLDPVDSRVAQVASETMAGEHHPGVITGKPIPLGGSEGRGDATARGGVYIVRETAKVIGINLNGKTMAIQGLGNAGQYAALLGSEKLGLKLVGVSDSKGGIYNQKGLDPKKVVDYKLRTGSLNGFPEAAFYLVGPIEEAVGRPRR